MIQPMKVSRSFSRSFATQFFVPKHDIVRDEDVEKVRNFLYDKPRILVLTGAGISTESGLNYFFVIFFLKS